MLAASVASSARADEEDGKRAAARALATEGAKEIEQGHLAEGIERLERAEAIVHAPPHLLYIARAAVKLGKLVKAHEAYVKVLREDLPANSPKAFVEARKAAATEAAALEPRLAKLTITLNGGNSGDLNVTIDGAPVVPALVGVAQPADPGEHVVRAAGPGWNGDEAKVSLTEGATKTVTLNVSRNEAASAALADAGSPTAARGSRLTPLSIAALGVGVAGIAAGTFFLLQNRGHREDANDLCKAGCPLDKRSEIESLDSKADTAAVISWIGYGVGAAGIIAGTTLILLRRSPPPATTGSVTPWIGAGAAGLEGTF